MERNLRLIKYYISFSMPFMLGPILHAFYDARGLLVSDYYILFAVSLGCVFLFELPTGIVADKLGYKQSLLLGSLFTTVSLLVIASGMSIYHFIIAEVIFAFGAAFISGADSGLVYDTLVNLGREEEYLDVYGKSRQLVFVAAGIGSVISSMLFTVFETLPIYINTVFVAISFVMVLFIKEPYRAKQNSHNYREQLRVVRKHIFRTKQIWAVVLMSSIVFMFYRPSFNLYRPFLKSVEVDVFYYGFIFFGLNVIAHFFSKRAELYFKLTKGFPLLGLILSMVITFFLMTVPILGFGLLGMALNQIVRGLYKPVTTKYVNDLTDSDIRATTLSFVSLVNNIAAAIGALVFSFFVNSSTVHEYVLVLALALIILTSTTYVFIYRSYGIK